MGIQGLLPFLKEASEPVHISKYRGYTVGIDTYCWIHRGAVGCATQLAKGDPADHYVRYCLKYVNMLRALDIKPVMVFDGRNLPAKAAVEESRRERRETYSKKGRQFLREGKASEARDCFVKCINVTQEMALDVMKAVRSLGVDCIVAPYEADAQLAYLAKYGFVQAVITEDSDLIAFGCEKVLVKLDLAGNCMEVDSSRLNVAMKIGQKFTPDKFRYMCIIAGCDYLASLPGIGIGKARKLFQLTTNPDITQVLRRMKSTLKMKSTVSAEYIESFQQANNTFLYQLAFDPQKKKLQPLTPYSPEVSPSTLTYAGRYVSEDKAYQMALGNINFNTMERMNNFDPMVNKPYEKKTPRHLLSIWHNHYQPGPGLGTLDQDHIEREVTKGKEISVETKQRLINKKRQREETEEVSVPSDAQLSTMYHTKAPHPESTGGMELHKVIPETPEKGEIEETKPSKRNRFATKLMAKKRSNIVNSGEVVTSRFFQAKKFDILPEKTIPDNEEVKMEEKVNLNSSGLLEGIMDIEMEQEKLFKMEDNEDITQEDDVIEIKTERTESQQTHVSKSIGALQRFQRTSSCPSLAKSESGVPRSVVSSSTKSSIASSSKSSIAPSSKSSIASSSKSQSMDMSSSQKSVIEIESSQDSQSSLDTCSQSSSLSSRQGTPRPHSAFSWSRKRELQGKKSHTGNKQATLGSLSNFLFKPSQHGKVMPRQNSSGSLGECSSQGSVLSRRDSYEMPSSPEPSSQILSLSHSIPGSMDMSRLGEDVSYNDSQNSTLSQSQNTSSITSDQSSQLTDTMQSSIPPQPPSATPSSTPPLPQLPFQLTQSTSCHEGIKDGERDQRMEGMRRTGLSRKRKKTTSTSSPRKDQCDASSPDTDDVSLSSSSVSSPSPPPISASSSMRISDISKPVVMVTPSNDCTDMDSLPVEARGVGDSSSCLDGERLLDGVQRKGMLGDEDEWENTPPGRGGVSPYKRHRSRSLSGKRHHQGSNAVLLNGVQSQKSTTLEPKKQSSLLGRCKASGLSKKRRVSGKTKPDATPKSQTSLLAFMAKPKSKGQLINDKGVSPLSPNKANLCIDITPETDASLLTRQAKTFPAKRHIFE